MKLLFARVIMNELQTILLWAVPIIFAITLHEVAHGFIAYKLGDGSAKMMGRITLNPFKHIDPVGTILVPIVLYFASGFVFGWARPVPVNFHALRNQKLGTILVALAGPLANLLMAIFWLIIFHIVVTQDIHSLITMASVGITINIVLFVFNLLPILPLDGGRILQELLPKELAYYFAKLETYGLVVVLAFVFLGGFETIIAPLVKTISLFLLNL